MGRRRRLLSTPRYLRLAALVCLAAVAGGQDASSRPDGLDEELPPALLAALAAIEDLTYDFDHPAYYALLEHVKHSPIAPGHACPAIEVTDWLTLIERPGDFRGRPITVQGTVGRNKDPYTHPRHPRIGQVWQVELQRPDQAVTCTVIFTNDASDLPLGASIRVTGYFVKINRYPTQSGRPGLAALLVAPGPTEVSRLAGRAATSAPDWRWMVGATVLGLGIVLVLLRRARRTTCQDVRTLRAAHEAPLHLADDLADWAAREAPEPNETDDDRRNTR